MRFADTLVLFIIGMVLFSPLALAATLTVAPNKTTYVPNDKLVVTGAASASSTVTIKVVKPNSDILGIEQGNTNAAGAYNVTVLAWPATNSTATPFGTYTIAVTDVLTGATAQATVKFAQSGTPTNTTTTSGNTTKTVTVTSNSTITKTLTKNTTVTSTSTATTTSVSSTTITSTTSIVTTTTSVSTQVSTVTSTASTTTTVLTTTTATKTTTGPAQTTTVTSTVSTGLPAEVTYAAVGIAVIAIIAAALLATRRRR